LTAYEIRSVVASFAAAARRALEAGFELVEIHGAHGYLLNEFYSPLANQRTDEYGGSFENRTRIVREVVEAVRKEWPIHLPLFLRISGTDWADGGRTIDDSVELARMVKPLGVDLIDCSSDGIAPHIKIPLGPGFQVPIAERLRRESGIMTGAVGLITRPDQAEAIIAKALSYTAQNQPAEASRFLADYAAQTKSAAIAQFVGQWFWSEGNHAQARAAWTRAKLLDSQYLPPDLALAKADLDEGKIGDARATRVRMVETDAGRFPGHVLLAAAETQKGNFEAAIEHYRNALQLRPHNAEILDNLAYLLADKANQPDEALGYA
jgi:tetratricopeptide (TPR) repeat protein